MDNISFEEYKELESKANFGSIEAISLLAYLYFQGSNFTPKNLDMAISLYEKAHKFGDKDTTFAYAHCLLEAGKNIDLAVSILSKFAKEGEELSSLSLAKLYIDGVLVPSDAKKGLGYLRKVKFNPPEKDFLYGRCLILGDGIKRNATEGISLLDNLIRYSAYPEAIQTLRDFFKVLYNFDNEDYEAGESAFLYAKLNERLYNEPLAEDILILEKSLPQEYLKSALIQLEEYIEEIKSNKIEAKYEDDSDEEVDEEDLDDVLDDGDFQSFYSSESLDSLFNRKQ